MRFRSIDILSIAVALPLRCSWQGIVIVVLGGLLYYILPTVVDTVPIAIWFVSVLVSSGRLPPNSERQTLAAGERW